MNSTTIRTAALTAIAGLALLTGVACGDKDEKSGGGKPAAGPQTIEVTMKDNVFEPKAFTVSAGQTVTFKLKNAGPSMHNMHILGDDVDPKGAMTQPTEAGKDSELKVKFTKKGSVKFQRDLHVPDMAGIITVN